MAEQVERYQGFWIMSNEDGFYWRNGGDGGGYYDTIEDCRECIRSYNEDELARNPAAQEAHWDSPSLPDPWWAAS